MTRIVNPISPSNLHLRNPITPFTRPAVTTVTSLPTGGLLGHWDASDPDNTDAVNDGDPVGQLIDDLSGLSNDMGQSVGAQKGIYKVGMKNGQNVIRFDGTDDNLQRTSDADFEVDNFSIFFVSGRDTGRDEVFAVFQLDIHGGTSRGFGLDVNLSKLRCFISPNAAGFHETFSDVFIGSGWHIFAAIKSGTNVKIYRDGELLKESNTAPATINFAGNPRMNGIGAAIIGGNPLAPMDGDFAQCALYGLAVPDSIRDLIHSILSSKWDIALI